MNSASSFPSAVAAKSFPATGAGGGAIKPSVDGPRFVWTHLVLPLLVAAVLLGWTLGLDGDQWLADKLYALEGGRWAWRQAFLTQGVIHQAGRDLGIALWLSLLIVWLLARRRTDRAHLRAPLAYLLVATALSLLCVSWVKSFSNMDCPWDLLRYGGQRPFVGLWQVRPVGLPRGACFPAGHASGGYAWLALYFFFGAVRPRWRGWGLGIGLALGLVFGVSQQLRGAHFVSHDVCTATICWLVALGTWWAFRPRLTQARWRAAGFAAPTGAGA